MENTRDVTTTNKQESKIKTVNANTNVSANTAKKDNRVKSMNHQEAPVLEKTKSVNQTVN